MVLTAKRHGDSLTDDATIQWVVFQSQGMARWATAVPVTGELVLSPSKERLLKSKERYEKRDWNRGAKRSGDGITWRRVVRFPLLIWDTAE
jgi:hypothetical protein